MYNTMNGVNVADKLGLGPEVRELKFGSSFTSGGRGSQQGSFHSVRYDFKPASVDTSKTATLDVGPNGLVTISMPNVDGNGTTVFKGARKPYAKECVLIIDNDTGEVVLEKLTHNIQVKRTREEGGSKKSGGGISMPPAPAPPPAIPSDPKPSMKTQPPPSFKSDPKPSSASRDREDSRKSMPPASLQHPSQQMSSKRGPSNSPKPPHQPPRKSPNSGPSPGHNSTSPPLSFSPAAGPSHSQEPHRPAKPEQKPQPNLYSLTNFEDLLAPMNPPPPASKPVVEKAQGRESASMSAPISKPPATSKTLPSSALSESSSGEDSSSSSSSDDDDDDSSDMEEVLDKVPIPPASDLKSLPVLGSSSSGGGGSSSRPHPAPPVALSMPTDLLCEDLQLSESGSDSD